MCTIHSNVCWVEEDIIIASWLYTCTSFLPRHGFPAAFFVHHWAVLHTKSIYQWAFLSKYIILWGDVWIISKYLEMLNICSIYHCCCNLFRNSLFIFVSYINSYEEKDYHAFKMTRMKKCGDLRTGKKI